MSDDIVENLKEPSQWLRVAYMIALAVAIYVAGVVLTLLSVAQAVFSLLTGRDNENLRALGKDLGTYVHQILEFLTYNSELKPFPFSPYPGTEEESIVVPAAAPVEKAAPKEAAETKAAVKKPSETKPAETKPAETKPAETKPTEKKPTEKKPTEKKPAAKKSAPKKPAGKAVAASKPAAKKAAKPAAEIDKKPGV